MQFYAFEGVAREIFLVAWIAFGILVVALLAAAAWAFFSNVARFDDDLREATMDLSPTDRRRFYQLYDARHPKNAAAAWFLAVLLGPAGANVYLERWPGVLLAIVTLNGFGAWWFESWFSTPRLVIMNNRESIEWVGAIMHMESVSP